MSFLWIPCTFGDSTHMNFRPEVQLLESIRSISCSKFLLWPEHLRYLSALAELHSTTEKTRLTVPDHRAAQLKGGRKKILLYFRFIILALNPNGAARITPKYLSRVLCVVVVVICVSHDKCSICGRGRVCVIAARVMRHDSSSSRRKGDHPRRRPPPPSPSPAAAPSGHRPPSSPQPGPSGAGESASPRPISCPDDGL